MTTSPVVSITDELIAELEAAANADPQGAFSIRSVGIVALLAERADLKQQLSAASVDADRYRFIRDIGGPIYCREIEYYNGNPCGAHNVQNGNLDAAIDAARNIGSGD